MVKVSKFDIAIDGVTAIASANRKVTDDGIRRHMKFCVYLVRDINFEPDAVQPCCNTKGLRRLPRFPFSGGRLLDMGEYRKHLEYTLEAMQEPGDMCAGCDQLVELDVPEGKGLDLKPLFATVSFNMHRHMCNCRCVYCSLWKKPSKGYEVLPALKSLASQHAFRSNCFFSWGGGEPSILREFENASRWILEQGYFQYVHSNALRFSPVLADLLARGRGGLNVSLDSGSSVIYREVKGVDAFDTVVANIRAYAEAARSPEAIELKYIVFEKNNTRDEIERFFALCRVTGVRRVQFSLNFLEVNAGALSEATLDAAAWFFYRATALGMRCTPFFLSDTLVESLRLRAEAFALADG
jgi:sulfatase maturation enzyme AslB (radical SAM superfamily)